MILVVKFTDFPQNTVYIYEIIFKAKMLKDFTRHLSIFFMGYLVWCGFLSEKRGFYFGVGV
jgi:hypothetical protein